jgi:hypothetical protein
VETRRGGAIHKAAQGCLNVLTTLLSSFLIGAHIEFCRDLTSVAMTVFTPRWMTRTWIRAWKAAASSSWRAQPSMLGCGNPCGWSISHTLVLRHSNVGPGWQFQFSPTHLRSMSPGRSLKFVGIWSRWYPYIPYIWRILYERCDRQRMRVSCSTF